MRQIALFIALFGLSLSIYAQEFKWLDPQKQDIPCIQQRGWTEEMKNSYTRFPDRAQAEIRPAVWNHSRNAAGLTIHFYAKTPQIKIRYTVAGSFSMPHMPATGVSGVDLYAIDKNGAWSYCHPNYQFGDTVSFNYNVLDGSFEQEYRLFLPLYNTVKWLEIGVPEEATFEIIPVRREKPIVVYGTSIAHGGCASRPANGWTNMLSRQLDWPVINLGFSGNGRLETEVLNLINEIDAAVYVLDCFPNLEANSIDGNTKLTIDAVKQIRSKHPATPIVIVEHAGYSSSYQTDYKNTNQAARKAYESLQNDVTGLYYLSQEEIAQPMDGTVDGIHPNDYGMAAVAAAHEKLLRNILRMPVGDKATTTPVAQRREPAMYSWGGRHQDILAQNIDAAPRRVILGNSITHYWGEAHRQQNGADTWQQYMKPAGYRNMGCGWDYIQNVLWRVYHGELDGFKAEQVVVNIGTNNLGIDSDEDIVAGILFLLSAVRERQPDARIKFVGIHPRRNDEKRIAALNKRIAKAVKAEGYNFCNVSKSLLLKNGKIDESLFLDGLHPNATGYARIAKEVSQ